METYLFKFSGCLLVFWLVYILFLERQTMHRFKRFYLLGAVASALIIPILTITHYIEPIVKDFEVAPLFIPIEPAFTEIPLEQAPFWTLENILWLFYGIGVLLFSIRFTVNLFKMYKRISNNETITKRSFVYVLLEEYRIPHSFFKYIFFNKLKYKEQSIPKEVMLHEETHAKQLHSLDVLVIELLQIIFWFNPLIYILKYHIKLNHEFLADQAVLNQGSDAKTYQNILLQFSSSTQNHQLSSAINYSSIKKRFTVMKTQTSKTRIWLSTLLVLPIIAVLFYSFAERDYVEKDITQLTETTDSNLFLVTVEKNGNTLELKCESGCRWSHLILEPSSEPYVINDFGFSEGNTIDRDKFTFSINTSGNGVKLNGLKGTAWIDLAFSLTENKKQSINQSGMTNTKAPSFEGINNDLRKRAEENYYTKQFFKIKNDKGKYVKKRFYELSYEDKIKWVYAGEIPYTKIDVTESHFKEAKNSKDYIIKVNGNYISREDLIKYKASDFMTFSYIPIPEIAKMKEHFVLNLVTPHAYKIYMELMLTHYNLAIEDYEKEINLPENEREKDIRELVSIYEFLKYNHDRFTTEVIKKHNLKLPSPIAVDIIKKVNQSYLDIPILFIDENENIFLNEKSTSLETIKEDFNNLTKFQKSELILEADGRKIHKNFLDKIMLAIEDNLKSIKVTNGQALVFDPNYKSEEFTQEKPIMWILINRHDQLLVDDEIGTLKSIEDKLKKLAKVGKSRRLVFIKYDKETSKEIISKVEAVVKANKFKVASFDASIPPPPPPPTKQEKATVKQVAEYNAWAKKINTAMAKAEDNNDVNAYPIVKVKEVNKYKAINDSMTAAQKKASEPWPSFPPPPPPPPAPEKPQDKSGPITINGATYYFIQQSGKTTYFDRFGKVVDINKIPPPPPIPNDATPEQKAKMKKATDAYMKANADKVGKAEGENGEVFDVIEIPEDLQGSIDINGETFYYTTSNGKTTYFNRYGKEAKMDNLPPPPPAPESTLDFVIRMAKTNAKFFSEGKSISSDKAIALLKKKPKLNINVQQIDTNEPLVYISKKPMIIGRKGRDKN